MYRAFSGMCVCVCFHFYHIPKHVKCTIILYADDCVQLALTHRFYFDIHFCINVWLMLFHEKSIWDEVKCYFIHSALLPEQVRPYGQEMTSFKFPENHEKKKRTLSLLYSFLFLQCLWCCDTDWWGHYEKCGSVPWMMDKKN